MGKIIDEISLHFMIDKSFVATRSKHHNKFYRVAKIPKKSGGSREIYLPNMEIKAFQYYIFEKYLNKLTVSKYAQAYCKGKSIVSHVNIHRNNKHFLMVDIISFFDNISYSQVKNILVKELSDKGFTDNDVEELLSFITYKNKFVQGCVTSPQISNVSFYEIDKALKKLSSSLPSGKYSRYSDDIVISSSDYIGIEFLNEIKILLAKNGYEINDKKTYFTSDASKIRITGLNLINYSEIKVGTKYKKDLKNMIFHKLKYRNKSDQKAELIIGKLMFLKQIEPKYFNTLNIKYEKDGQLLIDRLRQINIEELSTITHD